jgi:hypothetical protein
MSKEYILPKNIEDEKNKLNVEINKLIFNFEKQTNVSVLMFHDNKKPFSVALLVDIDKIKLQSR